MTLGWASWYSAYLDIALGRLASDIGACQCIMGIGRKFPRDYLRAILPIGLYIQQCRQAGSPLLEELEEVAPTYLSL